MNKLFRPKCMRRMAVFMALVAPIVYLFGVAFSGLMGAHGNSPFDSSDEIVLEDKEIIYSQSFGRGSFNHTFDGNVLTGNNGYYSGSVSSSSNDLFNLVTIPVIGGHVYCYCTFADGPNMSNATWQLWLSNPDLSLIRYYVSTYVVFSVPNDDTVTFRCAFYPGQYDVSFITNLFDLSVMYPDSPTYESLAADFDVSKPLPFSMASNVLVPVYGVPDGSQYWFSQFFAKDNFLSRWGENAISENPYGFAPFGYFWRYLDSNVLHLSNDQAGLMAYGYMYYASHVLLFDVGFILVTFFLSFIQKVGDKIGGEER